MVKTRPAPPDVVIRDAVVEDVPAIIGLNVGAGRPSGTSDSYAAAADDDGRLVVVAECGQQLVGWGKTHRWNYPDGPAPAGHYLGGVTVLPSYRRRGIGGLLTHRRLDWIWERSATAWYVVNAGNTASIEMHREFGFELVAAAPSFHTVRFDGGRGYLMGANRPVGHSNQ
ncbi:N-acetyltransferase family protein [Arthrobacter sp. JSM 101049]|uniref:GNAT family N-acetyltransferase n=1 Tax=Arthrobacter sp. JSM 101049 TaxID=929097 RepID=UPI0035694860